MILIWATYSQRIASGTISDLKEVMKESIPLHLRTEEGKVREVTLIRFEQFSRCDVDPPDLLVHIKISGWNFDDEADLQARGEAINSDISRVNFHWPVKVVVVIEELRGVVCNGSESPSGHGKTGPSRNGSRREAEKVKVQA